MNLGRDSDLHVVSILRLRQLHISNLLGKSKTNIEIFSDTLVRAIWEILDGTPFVTSAKDGDNPNQQPDSAQPVIDEQPLMYGGPHGTLLDYDE
jgi:hypothetical protein